MVSRRQSAPVAALLAVPFATAEGALRGHPDAGLWPANRPPQGLRFHYCTREDVAAIKGGKPVASRRAGSSHVCDHRQRPARLYTASTDRGARDVASSPDPWAGSRDIVADLFRLPIAPSSDRVLCNRARSRRPVALVTPSDGIDRCMRSARPPS